MLGPMTTVINPENGDEKKFTFDYSYWSHDGESARDDGYNECAGEGKVRTDGPCAEAIRQSPAMGSVPERCTLQPCALDEL